MGRMNRALQIAKLFALLSLAAAGCAVTIVVLQLRRPIAQLSDASLQITHKIADKNGILDLSRKAIIAADIAAVEGDKVALKEGRTLDLVNDRVIRVLDSTDATLIQTRATLAGLEQQDAAISAASIESIHSLTAAVDSAGPVIEEAHATMKVTTQTVADLDAVIADQDIKRLLTESANTAANLDATSTDVRVAAHDFLHPGWKTKVVNWTANAIHTIGGWF